MTNQTSDFGGYLDILVDFTIYGLIPVAACAGSPSLHCAVSSGLLEVTFFVNAAGLFMLSAILAKRGTSGQHKKNEDSGEDAKKKKNWPKKKKGNKEAGQDENDEDEDKKNEKSDEKDEKKDVKAKRDMSKELTTVNMPPALMEGFESMILFFGIIILPEY